MHGERHGKAAWPELMDRQAKAIPVRRESAPASDRVLGAGGRESENEVLMMGPLRAQSDRNKSLQHEDGRGRLSFN